MYNDKKGGKMDLNEYQKRAEKYNLCAYEPEKGVISQGFNEAIMGLAGESGELIDKFKKIVRDKHGFIEEDDRTELEKELGDVLWYVAAVARYLGLELDHVASVNLDKLESRRQRGKLSGSGDNR